MSKLAEALRKLADDIDSAGNNHSFVRKVDFIEVSSHSAVRIGFEVELGQEAVSSAFFDLLRGAHYSRD